MMCGYVEGRRTREGTKDLQSLIISGGHSLLFYSARPLKPDKEVGVHRRRFSWTLSSFLLVHLLKRTAGSVLIKIKTSRKSAHHDICHHLSDSVGTQDRQLTDEEEQRPAIGG